MGKDNEDRYVFECPTCKSKVSVTIKPKRRESWIVCPGCNVEFVVLEKVRTLRRRYRTNWLKRKLKNVALLKKAQPTNPDLQLSESLIAIETMSNELRFNGSPPNEPNKLRALTNIATVLHERGLINGDECKLMKEVAKVRNNLFHGDSIRPEYYATQTEELMDLLLWFFESEKEMP